MSEKTVSAMMLTLILVAVLGLVFNVQPFSVRAQETFGSRHSKGLEIYFFSNSTVAYMALKTGEVDFIQSDLTSEQYRDAVSDPTLQLAGYANNDMFEFDFNNNYTIEDYRDVRNPMNHMEFRRALAQMVDKDWIINEVLKGFGERIDAPLPALQMGWANQSVIGDNYPYPYNLSAAATRLDAAGFEDYDQDGTRNYPSDWPGRPDRPNLDPVKLCIRSDKEHRLQAGRALADNMRALNIPVNQIEAPSYILFPIVMGSYNYHIYTGSWSFPRRRPTHLYALFHTNNWGLGGSNYVSGGFSSTYPDLDEVLRDVEYATDIEGFRASVKKATGLLVDYCICVWLWSSKNWWAYSKNLVGTVDMEGAGSENAYTFLNAYKVDDSATLEDESQESLKMGTVHVPNALNILYSKRNYEYAVLDRIFNRLLAVEPYNLAEDNPWIAQDWEVTTWYDGHEPEPEDATKTKVTYWIRKDVWWHAPVTGEAVRQFTAHDVEFTIWYIYAFPDCWHWDTFKNVHHTKILDNFTIEVYFNTMSIWHQYNPIGPLLPNNEYLSLLCSESSATFYSDGTNCTASTKYVFTDDEVVQVINAYVDGTSLVEGVDFEIFAKGHTHSEIHFLANMPEGTVTINYYKPTVDPRGYYLGGLGWAQTFYSLGPYYPTSITSGVGGSAIFNCVSSYFLETPPLGEIDWKWTWTGTSKPRSGYYQINLYDAVTLLKAYGSSGYGTPDTNWFPGADLNPYDPGRISLYDAVTVISKYGTKWGTPP